MKPFNKPHDGTADERDLSMEALPSGVESGLVGGYLARDESIHDVDRTVDQ
ncbi:hypothetical protein GCM10022225_00030 [Plantactinospora mayteni]